MDARMKTFLGCCCGVICAVFLGLSAVTPRMSHAGEVRIKKIESLYNDISLYKRDDGYYFLTFGARRLHYIESIVNPNDLLELPVDYTRLMTLGVVYSQGLSDAAMIGLGGGRTSWYLHKFIPNLRMSAAELDPAVVQIDKEYFGIKDERNFRIHIEDGRIFLFRAHQKFDMIFVDAYRGPFVPFQLLTREFFALAKEHLKPGGVLVQNIEPTTMLFDSAVATISSVFSNLDFYKGGGNIVAIAYDGQKKTSSDLQKVASQRQLQFRFRYPLLTLLDAKFQPRIDRSQKPLTDDFAPAEYLRAIKRHNMKQN